MRCEAVHPMGSWEELRRRLGPRRRVFAFTHPRCVSHPEPVRATSASSQRQAHVAAQCVCPWGCCRCTITARLSARPVHVQTSESSTPEPELHSPPHTSPRLASGASGGTPPPP